MFLCAPGYYCPLGANVVRLAVPCEEGTFSPGWGATSISSCAPCSADPGYACGLAATDPSGVICPAAYYCPGADSPKHLCALPPECASPGLAAPIISVPVWAASTLAGSGTGYSNGQGTAATFTTPRGLAVHAADGIVLVTDVNCVRKVTPTGAVSTIAGTCAAAGFVNGAALLTARFNTLCGVAFVGDVAYVVDYNNHAVRAIDGGQVTSVAGNGTCGSNTTASNGDMYAVLCHPTALAADSSGFLFVADGTAGQAFRIRMVDPVLGGVSLLVGWEAGRSGVTTFFTPAGQGWLGDMNAVFFNIGGIAVQPDNSTLYVTDTGNTATASSNWAYAIHIVPYAQGARNNVTCPWCGYAVGGPRDGSPPVFNLPVGIAFDASGAVLIADSSDRAVRGLRPPQGTPTASSGFTFTLAGSGISRLKDGVMPSFLSGPSAIALDGTGSIVYVVDGTRIRVLQQTTCPAGYFCGTPYYATLCTPGYFCPLSAAQPTPCPAGLFLPAAGATDLANCSAVCPAGSYCATGSAYPSPCPDGTFSPAAGASSAADCTPCSVLPGWACYGGSASGLGAPCPAGSFCSGGSAGPIACSCPNMCTAGSVFEPFANTAWSITTVAGTGTAGSSNGAALSATFNNPRSPVFGADGTLYIADYSNAVVRSLSANLSSVSTFAGSAGSFNWLDGGALTTARLLTPTGLAVVGSAVVVAEEDGSSVMNPAWRRTPAILWVNAGRVDTLLPSRVASSITVDGNIYTARFANSARGLASDSAGYLYLADGGAKSLRVISPNGTVTTRDAPGLNVPVGVAVDGAGFVLVSAATSDCAVFLFPPGMMGAGAKLAGCSTCSWADGTGPTACFNNPLGVAVNTAGVAFVADTALNIIRRVTYPGGIVTSLVGGGGAFFHDGLGRFSSLKAPQGIAVRADGALLIADTGNQRIRVATCAVCPGGYFCLNSVALVCPAGFYCPSNSSMPTACPALSTSVEGAMSAAQCGTCPLGSYCALGGIGPSLCPSGTYGSTTTLNNATCSGPCACTPGYACSGGATSPEGTPCPVGHYCAGGASPPILCTCPGACDAMGFAADPSGAFVWSSALLAGNGGSGNVNAVGSAASFNSPLYIALNATPGANGPLWVSDRGNQNLRSVALDSSSVQLLVGSSSAWRADGYGAGASFNGIAGVVHDVNSGNLFVGDATNCLVRQVEPVAGLLSTIAGSGFCGYANGIGEEVLFNAPSGIAISATGLLYVAESAGHRVRNVTQLGQTGLFAGSGTAGFSNSNSPFLAQFNTPLGLAVSLLNDGVVCVVSPVFRFIAPHLL